MTLPTHNESKTWRADRRQYPTPNNGNRRALRNAASAGETAGLDATFGLAGGIVDSLKTSRKT